MTGGTGAGKRQGEYEAGQPATPAGASGVPSWLSPEPAIVSPVVLLEQSLARYREEGNLAGQAQVLSQLAVARYVAGDADGAEAAAVECEQVALEAGDALSLPWGSLIRALVVYDRGDHDTALKHAETALARFRRSGDTTYLWRGTMTCMLVTKSLGRLMEARDYCLETIDCVEKLGEEEMATALPELAALVLALGHTSEAIVVYAAGLEAAEHLGVRYPPAAFDRYQARIATARSRLPASEFEAARQQGESLPLVEALEQVRRCVNSGRSRTTLPA